VTISGGKNMKKGALHYVISGQHLKEAMEFSFKSMEDGKFAFMIMKIK
jgi:hypothetical protein